MPAHGALRGSGRILARPPDDGGAARATSSNILRRRAWWWAAGAVALVAVATVLDLPTGASLQYRQSSLRRYLATAVRDVAQCRAGLHDALVAYVGSVTGTPTVAPGVPGAFAEQAITACGFTNTGVVALGTTAPPRTVRSPSVDRLARQLDAWAYLDAFTLLQNLKAVILHPMDRAARAAFDHWLDAIRARHAKVERLVETAERSLHLRPTPLPLTSASKLLPRGALPLPKTSGMKGRTGR